MQGYFHTFFEINVHCCKTTKIITIKIAKRASLEVQLTCLVKAVLLI